MKRKKAKLHLDEERAKFLGVAAGIAAYINVELWIIRLILIVSVLFGGWFIVPLYFVAWFCMEKDKTANLKRSLSDNPAINHLKNVDYKKGLYKNKKEGKVSGVCAGIADYLEISVSVVRLITFITIIISGFIALIAYFGASFILDETPKKSPSYARNPEYSRVKESLDEAHRSSRTTFKRCSRKFSSLHERLARLEAYVTSSKFKLHREFRNI